MSDNIRCVLTDPRHVLHVANMFAGHRMMTDNQYLRTPSEASGLMRLQVQTDDRPLTRYRALMVLEQCPRMLANFRSTEQPVAVWKTFWFGDLN